MSKMNNYIPLSIPCLSGNEKKYVIECLDSNWISSVGSYVDQFEEKFSIYSGYRYAVAVTNGTAALHLSLLALNIGKNDEVFVPSATFIASVNAIRYTGADPVFIDIDPENLGISCFELQNFIDTHYSLIDGQLISKKSGKLARCILPVHLYGHACEIVGLTEIARKYSLHIIEDAAEGVGCRLNGKHVGTFGDIGCFSFNGNKTITTGGGGMVITNQNHLAKKIRHLANQAKCNDFRYHHDDIGYNYRMMNIQAAIGVGQLEHIDEMINKKRVVHQHYEKELAFAKDIHVYNSSTACDSTYWMCLIQVPTELRNKLSSFMMENQIQVRPFWDLIHKFSMYKNFQHSRMENSIYLSNSGLCIPCHQQLTEGEILKIVNKLKEFSKDNFNLPLPA